MASRGCVSTRQPFSRVIPGSPGKTLILPNWLVVGSGNPLLYMDHPKVQTQILCLVLDGLPGLVMASFTKVWALDSPKKVSGKLDSPKKTVGVAASHNPFGCIHTAFFGGDEGFRTILSGMFRGILDLPGFDWVHLVWNPPVTEGSFLSRPQATSCVSQFLKLQDPLQPKVRSKEFKCKPWRFEDGEAKKLRNTSGKVSNKLPAAFLLRILRLEDVSSGRKNLKTYVDPTFRKKIDKLHKMDLVKKFDVSAWNQSPKRRNEETQRFSPEKNLQVPKHCNRAIWSCQSRAQLLLEPPKSYQVMSSRLPWCFQCINGGEKPLKTDL